MMALTIYAVVRYGRVPPLNVAPRGALRGVGWCALLSFTTALFAVLDNVNECSHLIFTFIVTILDTFTIKVKIMVKIRGRLKD